MEDILCRECKIVKLEDLENQKETNQQRINRRPGLEITNFLVSSVNTYPKKLFKKVNPINKIEK